MVDLAEQIAQLNKGKVDKKEIKIVKKDTKKESIKLLQKPKKQTKKKDISNTSKIVGHFGMHGTGKTYRSLLYAKNYGKMLYITTELKVKTQLEENDNFSDIKYKLYHHKDVEKKKDIEFDKETNVDIFFIEKINDFYDTDNVASIDYFLKLNSLLIPKLQGGYYNVVVIDNCSTLKDWGFSKWLDDHKGRERPDISEWSDIQILVQKCILPYINVCIRTDKILILNFGITGDYISNVEIGTKEDAKPWLLRFLEYELWLERDYKIYCLKHPYKPFWEYQDENEDISILLFSKDFVGKARSKPYIKFKEEVLMSESWKNQLNKQQDKNIKLKIK